RGRGRSGSARRPWTSRSHASDAHVSPAEHDRHESEEAEERGYEERTRECIRDRPIELVLERGAKVGVGGIISVVDDFLDIGHASLRSGLVDCDEDVACHADPLEW